MSTEFKLPELGEDVDEGEVLKVLVAVGDQVEKDEPVLEIETDKATLEVPSSVAGRVEKVAVSEGDRVTVGQVLLVVDGDRAARGDEAEEAQAERAEGQEEDEKEEPRSETDEQKEEAEAREEEAAEEEEEEEEEEPDRAASAEARAPAPAPAPAPASSRAVPASPSVRRLARELGVDIEQVDGSGASGRLTPDDVKQFARSVVVSAGGAPRPTLPEFEKWGTLERERMTGLQRTAALRLARAWAQIPHVTHHDHADVTEIEAVRKKYASHVEALGGKLTLTAVAIHIVSAALKKFPVFNASVDLEREEIVLKRYVHIGVAVDTDRGLLVPVIRNADRLSLSEISVALSALSERARSGKLAREDMEGGTFTVTNLGGIGGSSFTPIVNWPEVAILGMSRARPESVASGENGNGRGSETRLLLPLSLSYDHRLIDGASAARFVRFVSQAFEHPLLLSLDERRRD